MALPDPKIPNRAQLFKLFGTHELVRLFEKLFERSGDLTPAEIETLQTEVGVLQTAVVVLQTEVGVLQGEVITLQGEVTVLQGIAQSNEIRSKSNGVLTWLSM